MAFWSDYLIDRAHDLAVRLSDAACYLLEWYTHSDDVRASSQQEPAAGWVPLFSDDDGDYCDDYDIFFDEYDWESSNDLV